MPVPVQVPKQGNTVEECLLVEWRVKEGDAVKAGDILCAIETDKAAFEVESPAAGTVLALFRQSGELVKVLTNIAAIGNPGEDVSSLAPDGTSATPAKAETPASTNVSPSAPAASRETPVAASASAPAGESPVSPRARKTAERLGVDAVRLAKSGSGSGLGGRVVEADVLKAADAGARLTPAARAEVAATGKPSSAGGGGSGIGWQVRLRDLADGVKARIVASAVTEEALPEIPYKGIRKLIGDRMRQSLAQHAQLTLNSSADATELMAFRQAVKLGGPGLPNVTLNDLVCWVVAQTLPRFPEVNAIFDISGERLIPSRRAHLGVAVDTPRGLLVPTLLQASQLALLEFSARRAELAEQAAAGSINPDLLQGATFTVTNLGSFGIESFTPVLNLPQVAILGVDAIRPHAVVNEDGTLGAEQRIGFSLTADHRVLDGADAARYLRDLCSAIADIDLIVMG